MSKQLTTTREERGQTIAQKQSQVTRIVENFYTVLSQSGNGDYAVSVDNEWICEWPDNEFRHVKCKHIFGLSWVDVFQGIELVSLASSSSVIDVRVWMPSALCIKSLPSA